MKKVLFATTALIATASVAAADVRLSGYGRFGLDYNDANDSDVNGISEYTITSRFRLQVDVSAETDGGVGFDGRLRAQIESRDNVPGTNGFNGARFGVTYEGLRLNVGNIIGAIENTPGIYLETRSAGIGIDGADFVSNVANVNDEFFNWDAYSSSGAGANGVEVLYTFEGFTGHISYSEDNDTLATAAVPVLQADGQPVPGEFVSLGTPAVEGESRAAIMLTYNWNDITVAAAYQDTDLNFGEKTIVTASYDGGTWGARVAYADNDGIDKWGIYGNVDIGAAANLVAFVTDEDAVSESDVVNKNRTDNRTDGIGANGRPGSDTEGTSYGLNLNYDLGGGVSLIAGYRRASNDNDTFQAGAWFSF